MTQNEQAGQHADLQALRAWLRRDLGTALKARHAEAVAALRTTIATIDNAEAVDAATKGVGTTQVRRRDLSMDEVRAILHNHIDDYVTEANRYQSLGQQDAVQRLRESRRAASISLDAAGCEKLCGEAEFRTRALVQLHTLTPHSRDVGKWPIIGDSGGGFGAISGG